MRDQVLLFSLQPVFEVEIAHWAGNLDKWVVILKV